MDMEEQSIVEEYASSLEDLTFNSKPLINVLTMLAEENSRYASSVTKLIEERIYKVPQQLKLPSLYLLDSIIKNVGGTYLNLIAQVLLKVFVAVFEKGDEKTRKDLYKLRHTWPQYFSAKILHDVDININKLDPGWPITAVPPPSPSIHVNPKFLKKAEGVNPHVPVVASDSSKENEKEVLLEHQKRLAELQRLQEEQLRLTEQEIQEHQLKRDLILKKQEQERKALMTQQQHVLLTLRLESELGVNSDERTTLTTVSTKAEMTPSAHNITTSRDPRLQRQEQAPSHNSNNRSQQQGLIDNELNHNQTSDTKQRDQSNAQRPNRNTEKTQGQTLPNSTSKRRSRSQSPSNEREKKFQRHDGHAKNRNIRVDPGKHITDDRQPKLQRSLDGSENVSEPRREFQDIHGQFEPRGYRGRGFNRGREEMGRGERGRGGRGDSGRGERGRGERGRGGRGDSGSGDRAGGDSGSGGRTRGDRGSGDRGNGDRGREKRGRGGRGRGERGTREQERERTGKHIRDDMGQHLRGSRCREEETRQRTGHLKPENPNSPQTQFDDIESEKVPNLVQSKPLFSEQEIMELQANEVVSPENDSDSAPIPQELSLEHRSVILEEAKRRLDAGHISQEQYIELIDKLCEFYELQRQQELESEHSDENIHDQNVHENIRDENIIENIGDQNVNENVRDQNVKENPEVHSRPSHGPRNQHSRGARLNRRPWKRRPVEGTRKPHREGPPRKELRIDELRRRDGPSRINQAAGLEGPTRPSRIVRMDDLRRDHPHVREGRPPMDRPHPPDSGPWRDNERPSHERGSPHHHHPLPEQSGNLIPQNIKEMEFREPGLDPRHFDERFHHSEVLLERGRLLPGEGPPLGHGRPVDNFQGPPTGPCHDLPPHLRNVQPGRPMQHHMDSTIGRIGHPREPPPGHHMETDQMPVPHVGIHHGPLPIEAGLHPHYLSESGVPPVHCQGEPGPHPGKHLGDSGLHQVISHGEPCARPIEPGHHQVILHGEPDVHLDQQTGIPPLIRRREGDLLTAIQHEEPGLNHGQRPLNPGLHPGRGPGEPGLPPGHPNRDSGLPQALHPGEVPDRLPGQPHLYPGHHITDPGLQGIACEPGQQLLKVSVQGSPQRHGTATPPPSIASATPPTPSRMDKKTVNDLFSRLVQVGIIKVAEEPMVNTPPRISTPPIMQQPLVNTHPVVHPVSSAQPVQGPTPTSQASTMTPMNLQKLQEMIEKSREASTVIPIISLNPHDLKKRHSGIISLLYKGKQCSTCGLRFDGEAEAFYREHLDWHFRRNRREKDGRRIAHKQWFIPLKDWLEYEEITDPEEKAHSSFFDAEKPNADKSIVNTQVGDGSCPVLPTDTEAESVCDICQEKFEQFWEETQEEWHYKEAIRAGGKTYHEMCYQDAKSNVEGTATEAEANVENTESEEASQGASEIKEEVPDAKEKDSTRDAEEVEVPPTVKKEDKDTVIKVESVKSSEPQCSASEEDTNGLSSQSDKAMKNEVKIKIEVTESTNSPIKLKEINKGETDGEGTSVIKTESVDKD